VVRGIPVYSHCEHHLAPFFGKATVGYLPNGKIVGLSKLTRLVDVFSKRLQVQERMTVQIANTLMEVLEPKAVGVVIKCRHMCMESRGIRTPGRGNHHVDHAGRTAAEPGAAHRVPGAGPRLTACLIPHAWRPKKGAMIPNTLIDCIYWAPCSNPSRQCATPRR
jgi:hypothetical protein